MKKLLKDEYMFKESEEIQKVYDSRMYEQWRRTGTGFEQLVANKNIDMKKLSLSLKSHY